MAKKKKQFPKRSRNILIGSVIALGVLLLTAGGIAASVWWSSSQRNYIGTVNGTKVSIGEYKLNLFEQQLNYESYYGADVWSWDLGTDYTVADIAKDAAFNSTMSNYISAAKAKEYGVDKLSEEQAASVDETINLFHQYYGEGVMSYLGLTDDELKAIFSADFYAQNLYDHITSENYVFDQDAYDADFEVYYEENMSSLKAYVVQYLITEDEASINEAMERYANGEDFRDLMAEYSVDYIQPQAPADETDATTPPEDAEPTDSPDVSPEPSPKQSAEPTASPSPEPSAEPSPEPTATPSPEPSATPSADEPGEDQPADEPTETQSPDGTDETDGDNYLDLSEFDYVYEMSEYDLDENIFTFYGSELPSEIADAVFALEKGGVTAIIPLWNDDYTEYSNYIVLMLIDTHEPNKESEKETYKETYISDAKSELYSPIFSAWAEEYDVVRNDKAYDAVTIYGY